MWRYIFVIMLVLVVLFIVLFVKSELALDQKLIRYANYKYQKYDDFRRKTSEDFEEEWNREHPGDPIDVVYEPVGGSYDLKLNTQLVANTLPDVFMLTYSFTQYAKDGGLLDLKPLIDKYDDWDLINELYPELVDYHRFGDHIYGLPGNLQVFVLYYNKTLFDREGIPYPDETWTWDDLRDAAVKLTKRDSEDKLLQAGISWHFDVWSFVLMNGGEILNKEKDRCIIFNERAIEGVEYFDELYNKLKVIPSFAEAKGEHGYERFKRNRCAMMVHERWWTSVLNELSDVKWGVAPLPISRGGVRRSWLRFNNMVINAKTKHPDIAYKFLLNLISPKVIKRAVDFGESIPIRSSKEANREFLNDPTRPAGENQIYMTAMNDGTFSYYDIFPRAVPMQETSAVFSKWRDRWRMDDNVTTEVMLKNIEKEVNELIEFRNKEVKAVKFWPFARKFFLIIVLPILIIVSLNQWKRRKDKRTGITVPTGSLSRKLMVKPRRQYSGYLFLIPNFVGFLAFTLLPVIFSFIIAFCKWNLIAWPPKFIGFGNFTLLLQDIEHFWQLLFNTVVYMLGIPIGIAGSLVLALILNQKIRGRNFFRAIYFLPSFCAGVALFVLWAWIYNTEYGLLNSSIQQIFNLFGATWNKIDWLSGSPFIKFFNGHFKIGPTKPAIMLMGLWSGIGGTTMILYLAGLQGINPELYEVASIDGANSWQKFKHITWPLLSPTTFFIVIMGIIGGFQGGFQSAFIMTGGGPDQATMTISYGIFNNAFMYYKMGKASAISWILFVLVFVFTILNWRYGSKRVHYE